MTSDEISRVVLPPGLRPITLTPEGAEIMQSLLDDKTKPGHEGKEMPTADAEIIKKLGGVAADTNER